MLTTWHAPFEKIHADRSRYLEIMPVTPSLRSRAGSEPMRFAQGKLRERSGSSGEEILRFAQDDTAEAASFDSHIVLFEM